MWVQQSAGRWAAAYYHGQQYLDMIPDNPFMAQSRADQLNIRSGPGTSYAPVGKLKTGDVINVTGIDGHDAWVEFEPGKWAAFKQGITHYLQLS